MTRQLVRFTLAAWSVLHLSAAEPISLEVRVAGKGGSAVDLSASDFELKENGKVQDIESSYVAQVGAGEGQDWIYIAVDISPVDYPRTQRAILRFLDEMMKPGLRVSLGGSPFTDNAEDLKKVLLPGPVLSEASIEGQQAPGLGSLWKIGTDARLGGRPVLDSYTILARQLGVLPGKKSVVLFREGLQLDRDGLDTGNAESSELGTGGRGNDRIRSTVGSNDAAPMQFRESFDRLASEALRNRVSFYPVRPDAQSLGGDGAQGLNQLARRTGGEPLLSQGDPSRIFERVLSDAAGYYLLRYEPKDQRQRGLKRRIRVKVKPKGYKVAALGEYLERRPGEQVAPQHAAAGPAALAVDDKAMREMLAKQQADFPLQASYAVFQGAGGDAVVLYVLGVHPKSLKTTESKNSLEADFSIGALATAGGNEAAFAGVRERRAFPAEAFRDSLSNPRMRTNWSGELRGLAPGAYELTLGWKNEGGGAATKKLSVEVPDFSRPLAASSLFLTRDAAQGAPPPGSPHGDLLVVGDSRFEPDAATTFSAGETIFIVYHLYNAPEQMLAQPPAVQFVVLQSGQPVAEAAAGRRRGCAQAAEASALPRDAANRPDGVGYLSGDGRPAAIRRHAAASPDEEFRYRVIAARPRLLGSMEGGGSGNSRPSVGDVPPSLHQRRRGTLRT